MLGRASSVLCGCHSAVRSGVCSPVVGVEALRVRFHKAPLPLSACSVPKEVITEASEACVVTENLDACTGGACGFAQKQPKVMSVSLLCLSQT